MGQPDCRLIWKLQFQHFAVFAIINVDGADDGAGGELGPVGVAGSGQGGFERFLVAQVLGGGGELLTGVDAEQAAMSGLPGSGFDLGGPDDEQRGPRLMDRQDFHLAPHR